jgi:hypothetical protein
MVLTQNYPFYIVEPHFFGKEGAKKGITLCLHKSNQKAFFYHPQDPKNQKSPTINEQRQKSKNTSGSEYTSLKGIPPRTQGLCFCNKTNVARDTLKVIGITRIIPR